MLCAKREGGPGVLELLSSRRLAGPLHLCLVSDAQGALELAGPQFKSQLPCHNQVIYPISKCPLISKNGTVFPYIIRYC